jgi:arsenite oxidase small subunit
MKETKARTEPLWRDEFSVDQATDRYVTRRQFSKFLILTSLGMFVGNVWILIRNWLSPAASFQPLVIGTAEDIGIGEVKLFSYPTAEDPCILVRTTDDRFAAYSQKCTHLSCAVYYAKEQNRLECPCHEGYFSVEDGHVLQGPPPRPLPRVVLQRDGNNLIATGIEL